MASRPLPAQDAAQTYSFQFDAFGKKINNSRRQHIIESLIDVVFAGSVNLKKPVVQYYAVEIYDVQKESGPDDEVSEHSSTASVPSSLCRAFPFILFILCLFCLP